MEIKYGNIFFLVFGIWIIGQPTLGQIHRATNQNNYLIKYNSNFTLQYYLKRLNEQYSTEKLKFSLFDLKLFENFKQYEQKITVFLTSVIGTFFVGICGIVPVVILPQLAEDHNKLIKSTLFKCLVAFAAGTLLADVFIHLLPETYTKTVLSIFFILF